MRVFLPLDLLEPRRLLSGGLDPTFAIGGIMRFQPTGELDIVHMAPQTGSAFVVLADIRADDQLALARYDVATGAISSTRLIDPRLPNLAADQGEEEEDEESVHAGRVRIARQSSGKTIVAMVSDTRYYVARFNTDLTLDTSFGTAGIVTLTRPSASTTDASLVELAVREDDRVVLMALQTGKPVEQGRPPESGKLFVARFTANGALDTSYDGDGQAISADTAYMPSSAALQADGRIVTIGAHRLPPDKIEHFVARFNTDLTVDTSFADAGASGFFPGNSTGAVDLFRFRLKLQEDAKILVANVHNSTTEVRRFNTDGSPDSSFDGDGLLIGIEGLIGDIFPAGGKFTLLLNADTPLLARYNANGTLDSSFGVGGRSALPPLQGGDWQGVQLDDGRYAIHDRTTVASAGPRPEVAVGPNGALVVTGTSEPDTLSITRAGETLRVVRNAVEQTFALADIDHIDIAAEDGDDVISVTAPLPVLIDGAAGNDSITVTAPTSNAGAFASTIVGGDGDDTVTGSDAAEHIDGGAGNDSIDAGAGDDTVFAASGPDTVLLGDGNDSFQRRDTGSAATFVDGGAGNDRFSIEWGGPITILGGTGDDYIRCFGDGAKYVDAGNGSDVVMAGGASCTIFGGGGEDDISSWRSASISGGTGDDLVRAHTLSTDRITVSGDDGLDTIFTTDGNDSIIGGANKDLIHAGNGDDTVRGYGGHDRIFGQGGDDLLCGAAGNDRVDGGDGVDLIYGSDGDDSIAGGANKDVIYAGNGNDGVRGYGGNDRIFGQGGDDTLWGIAGDDRLDGGDGNDALWGNAGSNRLYGGRGDDRFWAANSTADTLDGGEGANRGTFDDLLDTFIDVIPA